MRQQLVRSVSALVRKLITMKYLNRWIVFCIDLSLSVLCTVIAYLLISVLLEIRPVTATIYLIVILWSGVNVFVQLIFKLYRGIIRHASIQEASRLLLAIFTKELLLFLSLWQISEFSALWVAVVCLDMILSFFMLVSVRALLVSLYYSLVGGSFYGNHRMFIYGTDNHSISLVNWVRSGAFQPYVAVGLLTVDMEQDGMRIAGIPVFGVSNSESLRKILIREHMQTVMFPDYTSVQQERNRFVEVCLETKIELLVAPSVEALSNPDQARSQIREIKIEDLLGRDQIYINMEEISTMLKPEVILVTGAAGSIGSEITRLLASINVKQLILFDNAETPMHDLRLEMEDRFPFLNFVPIIGDVRMQSRLDFVFKKYAPTVVFHAAAYKHVPLMEAYPCEAIRTNVDGTRKLADTAVAYAVKRFIMISTDKAVNPTNVMGASKRIAEMYVQSLSISLGKALNKTQFITTRFGNVLGSNGSVVARFREQIRRGGPVTVTHPDIFRYFMTIPEASRLVLEAVTLGRGGEIFVFDMGEPVKIADMARRMIQLAGLVPDEQVKVVFAGLRPGEKLYEELLTDNEYTLPTRHPKIRIAQVRPCDWAVVRGAVDGLVSMADSEESEQVILSMKKLVPEFISSHSPYEIYDPKN